MKKVIISTFAVVIMALTFASCNNSGSNGDNNGGDKGGNKEQGIVGNWYYSDDTFYTFNEDGTGSYTVYGNVFGNFNYTEGDGKLTLNYEGSTDPTVFLYKMDGNTLTILAGESNWGGDTEYKRK